eukprot:scaffold92868_cov45-Attheya_sp.AAC.1
MKLGSKDDDKKMSLLFFICTLDIVLMEHVMAASALGVAAGHNPCQHSTIYKAIHNEDQHEDNG